MRASGDGPSLAEWLGPVPDAVAAAGVDVDALEAVHHSPTSVLACNWKVACENYLECYHCQVAHPGFSAAIDVAAERYALEQDAPHVFSQRGARRAADDPLTAGPVAAGAYHLVWPNLVVSVAPGHPNLSLGPVLPRGPGRTARFLDYLAALGAPDGWLERLLAWDDEVGSEDARLVEAVQAGMASRGPLDAGVLLPASEQLVAGFAQLVRDHLPDP